MNVTRDLMLNEKCKCRFKTEYHYVFKTEIEEVSSWLKFKTVYHIPSSFARFKYACSFFRSAKALGQLRLSSVRHLKN